MNFAQRCLFWTQAQFSCSIRSKNFLMRIGWVKICRMIGIGHQSNQSTHSLLKARTLINISIFIASTSDMMALSSNWPLFSFEMFFKILPIWCINENTLRIVDTLYIAQCYLFSPKYQGEKIPKFGQRGKERWNLLFYTPLRANNPPLPVLAPSRPSKHDKDSRTWVFSIFLSGKMPTL